ncbi:unnamed protein product [Microthlaspi erraticum]|uniref:Endonuclease/exonuclease/phosphatase domain-containing protein n=1 Tax=Microthlaspi erraticum TaxID=1685480 RepID=A0A6D2J3L4_9BRAS|nr:unnamed protein product [Microthlaspi erraticum]
MDSSKKLGGPPRNKSSFWDFHTMAINCKLHELRSSGNRFSWAGWRDKVRVQWRLDRSFGNDGWYQLFPCSQLEYMDMWASDHRPLKVCFAMETELLNRGRFRRRCSTWMECTQLGRKLYCSGSYQQLQKRDVVKENNL